MKQTEDSPSEVQLRTALGSPAKADFEAWRKQHSDAIAYLNPVVAAAFYRQRKSLRRIGSAAAAAVLIVALGVWFSSSQAPTFAQAVNAINKAETITWTITWYDRLVSQDGKRKWLRKDPRWERSYMAGRYRDVRYDKDGNIAAVDIEDPAAGKVLELNMKAKTAMVKNQPSGQSGSGGNPFGWIAKALEHDPIEYVGKRQINGTQVNVFRYRREFPQGGHEITDIWLDAKTKNLVGFCNTPENEPFNPATDRDRENPDEGHFSKGTIAGVIHRDIVFDAQLDPKLFDLEPPRDFKLVEPKPRTKVSEEMLVEWLRITARANGGLFVDSDPKAFRGWHTAIYEKSKEKRSVAEQEFLDLSQKNVANGIYVLMRDFADDVTKPRTFRYIGKGAKLGDRERIVCFYVLDSTGKYRAVYGDLSVHDVDPAALPLPVGKWTEGLR